MVITLIKSSPKPKGCYVGGDRLRVLGLPAPWMEAPQDLASVSLLTSECLCGTSASPSVTPGWGRAHPLSLRPRAEGGARDLWALHLTFLTFGNPSGAGAVGHLGGSGGSSGAWREVRPPRLCRVPSATQRGRQACGVVPARHQEC